MARLRVLAFAATIAWTVPATAEGAANSRINALPSLSSIGQTALVPPERPRIGLPIVDYTAPNGTWQRPRGIIAGRQIAPGTVLGLGIFETAPKMRGYVGDVPQNMAPKRRKRAAIGLSMKF